MYTSTTRDPQCSRDEGSSGPCHRVPRCLCGSRQKSCFTPLVKHKIDVQGNQPIKCQGHRKSLAGKDYIAEEVKKLEENKQIQSKAPWSAQVVLAAQKDETKHFYIDFRWHNDITRKDAYP